jgi:alginate O-acetyltransferase complex protein AlgI
LIFSSPIFVFLFLPTVLALYFVLPKAWRNPLLLAASLIFYAWGESEFIVVLICLVFFNHFCGRIIHAAGKTRRARLLLAAAISVNLGLLVAFKYGGFFVVRIASPVLVAAGLHLTVPWSVHIPIGISFFTFHALSYLIDIYRGSTQVQPSLGITALYLTMFPQIVAGPIVRYKDIAAQFLGRTVALDDFALGVKRFAIGLGKKMLIANSVAITVDQIFALPTRRVTTSVAWLGVVCYTLQIYFDFSGYSDMAIGLARMFGFHLLENFNYPYISQSVQEFWRRWHISLTNWFRDYLYIPLGGNRGSAWRTYCNLVTVFFLCGLWHGARKTFVVWGLYYGAFLVLERLGLASRLAAWPRALRHVYTLLVVMVGWVFFRAETLSQAGALIAAMFGFTAGTAAPISASSYLSPGLVVAMLVGVTTSVPIGLLWTHASAAQLGAVRAAPKMLARLLEGAWIAAILVISLAQVAADTYNPFIYLRF